MVDLRLPIYTILKLWNTNQKFSMNLGVHTMYANTFCEYIFCKHNFSSWGQVFIAVSGNFHLAWILWRQLVATWSPVWKYGVFKDTASILLRAHQNQSWMLLCFPFYFVVCICMHMYFKLQNLCFSPLFGSYNARHSRVERIFLWLREGRSNAQRKRHRIRQVVFPNSLWKECRSDGATSYKKNIIFGCFFGYVDTLYVLVFFSGLMLSWRKKNIKAAACQHL